MSQSGRSILQRGIRRLGGLDWREDVDVLAELKVVPGRLTAWVVVLNILRTVTETFGLVMIWPILQFMESRGDVEALAAKSRLWRLLVDGFGLLHVPINLATLSGVVLALILLRQAVGYVCLVETSRLKEDVSVLLRRRLFASLTAAEAQHLGGLGTGRFTAVLGEQASLAATVLRNLVTMFSIYFTIAANLALLVAAAPMATLVTVVFGLFIVRVMRPLWLRAKKMSKKTVQGQIELNQFTAERYKNWRLLKLSGMAEVEADQCAAHARRLSSFNIEAIKAAGKIQLYLVPAAAIFALAGLWLAVEALQMSLSDINLFLLVVFRLLPVVTSYLNTRQGLANASVALHHVRDTLFEAEARREADSGSTPLNDVRDGIRFEAVGVTYPGRTEPALEQLSLLIPAGKMTAITGPSGAGKSTLVDLIPRLLEPNQGRITIDGRPLRDFQLASLRSRIAYVSQEPILFDGSVTDNVRYGRGDISDAAIREACQLANAEEFILQLPEGYNSHIGESGRSLSGGQRQRLALARIFLSDAAILILDEPTSALDIDSELHVRQAVERLRDKKHLTIIVIAHRLFTIRSADQLLVMRGGRLIQQGAPKDLAVEEGWFARINQEDAAGMR